jgi:hypothetical protein
VRLLCDHYGVIIFFLKGVIGYTMIENTEKTQKSTRLMTAFELLQQGDSHAASDVDTFESGRSLSVHAEAMSEADVSFEECHVEGEDVMTSSWCPCLFSRQTVTHVAVVSVSRTIPRGAALEAIWDGSSSFYNFLPELRDDEAIVAFGVRPCFVRLNVTC